MKLQADLCCLSSMVSYSYFVQQQVGTMPGLSKSSPPAFCPISTKLIVYKFSEYAKLCYHGRQCSMRIRGEYSYFGMLLRRWLSVPLHRRMKAFPHPQGQAYLLARSGDELLSLEWNGQDDICSHRRDVAHGEGGN